MKSALHGVDRFWAVVSPWEACVSNGKDTVAKWTRVQTPALHEAGRTQSTGASGAVLRTGFAGFAQGPLAQRHTLLQAHGGGF